MSDYLSTSGGKTAPIRPRGRFAPSPTGLLHFGSLVAAVGSYLEAKAKGGEWLVRIEDLDAPRTVPGAADAILRALEACGLCWDGAVMYQSRRAEAYQAALADLRRLNWVYPCSCSRREVADSSIVGPGGLIYPGTCRAGSRAGRPQAMRVRTEGALIEFLDGIQGPVRQNVEAEAGDFVLRRADGLYAYQLAVVVDDAEQGINQVVRGADLLDSTPRQIHLQRLLGLPTPEYLHLPVAVNDKGEKLSKQTLAAALDVDDPVPVLFRVLAFLGQEPPPEFETADIDSFWQWALKHWRREAVPRCRTLPEPKPTE